MGLGIAVIGTQWGDEGKGKIVDLLSERADVIARAQGGNNAGHTVVVGERQTILHLIPSGILHQGKLCIIGNGVAVDAAVLFDEIDALKGQGINITPDNLVVSDSAHLIMPYHIRIDMAREEKKGDNKIGTTCRGIGPAYSDKVSRLGIRVADLLDETVFRDKLSTVLEEKNFMLKNYFGADELKFDDIFNLYRSYAKRMAPFVGDASLLVNGHYSRDKKILFEGAQGTLLDIDHGTYPYVTSSNSTIGGICTGLGVSPDKINRVVGIVKAYTTRVGRGPFPTELPEPLLSEIRNKGGEFGATTGRPRRCGWFDAVVVRFSNRINGLTSLAITKLDVLDIVDVLRICTAYKYRGRTITELPTNIRILDECVPVYEEMPGWLEDTSGITDYSDLPANARTYLERISNLIGAPISHISLGKRRNQTIELDPVF
ncbi:MAG: adenylosuccinate synthase [archaeon]